MSLIDCKVELKLQCAKHCVLAATGDDNTEADPNNVIFTIKGTKCYVPVITLSQRDNQKLSKLLSKRSERSVYCKQYKTRNDESKNSTTHPT